MGIIKDLIRQHVEKKDDFISEWYWRRKYNSLASELEVLKDVMASDIYKKVIKQIAEPMEIKRYKRTIERLNNKCSFLLEERNKYYDELNKINKKKGGEN